MSQPITNLLLTGPPGCGKTTVVRRAVELLKARRLAGFYTEELREHGRRVGFEAVGLGGDRAILAHVGLRSQHRVGRYGVDLEGFERIIEAELGKSPDVVDVFVIDEIGKMETFSEVFLQAVARVLDSPVPVLAMIAGKGSGFVAQVKARSGVEIMTITAANRDRMPDELVYRIQSR